ncbi:L-proline trans-4-hydroxylase-like [Palaemon carinicauda]|uniref:L-proline trans-4-hydroxylase-like n=1 Tax=Palaemon carinicauda TaxID=392227 RepID=UPI0035B589E8
MVRDSDFQYDPTGWEVTQAMKFAFDENGYILVRNLLSPAEITKLRNAVETSDGIMRNAFGRNDGKERRTNQCIWNHPGEDVTGVAARPEKVAGTMEQLLGGDEIYHYHSKVTMKEPHTGGAFVWHQDYRYWYNNGNLFPDMGTVFMPIDESTRENGCLQILRGSHKMGRVDHVNIGQQLGADPERVEQAKKVLDHLYIEMKPGDALFFHCCLLHTSAQNSSSKRRWVFISCFNKRSNNPYKEHHHPQYTPMTKLPNTALLNCNVVEYLEGKWFMKVEEDHSVDRTKVH